MSKYTTEERFILEEKAGYDESVGFDDIDDVLDKSWDKIFTTQAEIFDEDYRAPLCKKILKHYYTREIGAETAGLWQFWMNRTLEEQLPYYNQLYKSALLKFPIFSNEDYVHNSKTENTGETTSDQTGTENQTNQQHTEGGKSVITDTKENQQTQGTDDNTFNSETDATKKSNTEEGYSEDVDKNSESNTTTSEDETGENSKTGSLNGTDTRNTNETTTHTNTHNDSTITDTTTNTTDEAWQMYSDTPQGGLDNITEQTQYLTNITKNTDENTQTLHQDVENQGGWTTSDMGTITETQGHTQSTGENGESEAHKDGESNTKGSETQETKGEKEQEYNETTHSETDEKGHDEDTRNTDTVGWKDEETTYHEDTNGGYDKSNVYNALGSSHDLEDFVERTKGKVGSETYAEMLMKFRDTFLNIDMDLISKFEENFIGLW